MHKWCNLQTEPNSDLENYSTWPSFVPPFQQLLLWAPALLHFKQEQTPSFSAKLWKVQVVMTAIQPLLIFGSGSSNFHFAGAPHLSPAHFPLCLLLAFCLTPPSQQPKQQGLIVLFLQHLPFIIPRPSKGLESLSAVNTNSNDAAFFFLPSYFFLLCDFFFCFLFFCPCSSISPIS